MTSILRLSKDRSSFLFRKHSSNDDAHNRKLALTLPDISRLDTQTFSDLFDHFTNYTSPDENQLQVYESPTSLSLGALSTTSLSKPGRQSQASTGSKTYTHQYGNLHLDIARNDSTGSSRYSQASHRESDFSPLVTRQSSSSSYTLELPLTTSSTATVKANQKLSVSATQSRKTPSNNATSSSVGIVKTSKLKSKRQPEVVVSPLLNLDKPLPPGPDERKAASLSAPNLLLKNPTKRPKVDNQSSQTLSSAATPTQQTFTHPERPSAVRRASTSQAVSELPAWTPKAIRQAKLEKTIAQGHRRKRSASETTVPSNVQPIASNYQPFKTVESSTSTTVTAGSQAARRRQAWRRSPISATTAEDVIYRIMGNLDDLDDLVSAAMVSKGFLRTFQRNESKLVSRILFKASPAAWELRRSILARNGLDAFRLKDFRKDSNTLATLKSYIITRCSAACKPATLEGLYGHSQTKKTDLNNALWRIWTFCILFGLSSDPAKALQIQIDWLNGRKSANNRQLGAGFGVGNGHGLNTQELEDICEMWQSMQSLLIGFHIQQQDARESGVFDNWEAGQNTSEHQHLTEWTSYLLALGPQTVVSLSSCSFESAKLMGLTTNWPLPPVGQSRTTFLMSAISKLYQTRVHEEATLKAARFSMPRMPSHRPTRSFDERQLSSIPSSSAASNQAQSLRVNTTIPKRRPVSTFIPPNTRFEIRPDCDPMNIPSGSSSILPTSPSADPSVFYGLGATPTVSAKLGATLFPMHYAVPGPRVPFQQPERAATTNFGVVDPVDAAMNVLVHELGFEETRARKALAMCDSGSGIDLQKAVELLAVDAKAVVRRPASPVELPTPQDLISPKRERKQSKSYCNGHCHNTNANSHSRHRSTGSASIASISPVSVNGETKWQETYTAVATVTDNTVRRKSVSIKAWKVLGMSELPKRKNSILGIEEYQAKVERKRSMRITSGNQSQKVKDGLGKNLLGLGLGIGSAPAAKTTENQLEHARAKERLKKERPGTFYRPRNNASAPLLNQS